MSLSFHFLMVITGLLIVVSKYKTFNFKDIITAWIPVLAFSIIVIPVDYILKADYMLYYYGNGAPILPDLANFFASHNLRFIYTIIMVIGYAIIAGLFISVYKLIGKITKVIKAKNCKKATN